MLPATYLQTTALAADASNARLAARMSEQWRAFTTINDFYLGLKGAGWVCAVCGVGCRCVGGCGVWVWGVGVGGWGVHVHVLPAACPTWS